MKEKEGVERSRLGVFLVVLVGVVELAVAAAARLRALAAGPVVALLARQRRALGSVEAARVVVAAARRIADAAEGVLALLNTLLVDPDDAERLLRGLGRRLLCFLNFLGLGRRRRRRLAGAVGVGLINEAHTGTLGI